MSMMRRSGSMLRITPWQTPDEVVVAAVVREQRDDHRRRFSRVGHERIHQAVDVVAARLHVDAQPELARRLARDGADRDEPGGGGQLAARVEEEAHGRARGEGHVGRRARAARGGRRRAARRGSRRARRRRPRRRARAARPAAPSVPRPPAPRAPGAPRPGSPPSSSTRPSATKRSGTTSARIPCRSSSLAVPGPIAATVAPPSARASCPVAASASNSSRTPFGLVRQTSA